MKQLVLLSGKGGTGKTSVAAAFAHLAHDGPVRLRAVLADADVDAANLELVLSAETLERHEFVGGSAAVIAPDRCGGCGICSQVCRFDAIQSMDQRYWVDPVTCDGCAACVYQCPQGAIGMQPQVAGQWFQSQTRYGPLFHAALRPAHENSGKLVTLVKQHARLWALDEGYPVMIVDGPPGIGCPVISAVSGADLALIVAEPTVAGIHDMQRALQMTQHFRVPAQICINKADVYPVGTVQIVDYCQQTAIPILGQIPFDPNVTDAMVHGEPITAYRSAAPASRILLEVWQRVAAQLSDGGDRCQ